jgi:hypothetical protein
MFFMRFRFYVNRYKEIEDKVDRGLGSVGKLKILRLLISRPHHAFTRYELGKKIPIDLVSIRNDINVLMDINWVTEFKVQHLSKYSINLANPIINKLIEFFRQIGYV